jgi:16S rRNA (cytidine1402-2'-O)-methyltransferase
VPGTDRSGHHPETLASDIETMAETKNAVLSGTLYVVSTPIGNLADVTDRARTVLSGVDIIAAEDTRTTRRLLDLLGLRTDARLVSYHDHNAAARAVELCTRLSEGASIALVSDAGTPCMSDPGMRLVRAASEVGHPVTAVPGACAFVAALTTSGLPTDQVAFYGFLPNKQGKRRAALEALRGAPQTHVVYEAPTRVVALLRDVEHVFGDRRVSVHRELTKLHEETLRGTAGEVAAELAGRDTIRGELTVVIAGARETMSADETQARSLTQLLVAEGLSPNAVKRVVATFTGVRKRAIHDWLIQDSDQEPISS